MKLLNISVLVFTFLIQKSFSEFTAKCTLEDPKKIAEFEKETKHFFDNAQNILLCLREEDKNSDHVTYKRCIEKIKLGTLYEWDFKKVLSRRFRTESEFSDVMVWGTETYCAHIKSSQKDVGKGKPKEVVVVGGKDFVFVPEPETSKPVHVDKGVSCALESETVETKSKTTEDPKEDSKKSTNSKEESKESANSKKITENVSEGSSNKNIKDVGSADLNDVVSDNKNREKSDEAEGYSRSVYIIGGSALVLISVTAAAIFLTRRNPTNL